MFKKFQREKKEWNKFIIVKVVLAREPAETNASNKIRVGKIVNKFVRPMAEHDDVQKCENLFAIWDLICYFFSRFPALHSSRSRDLSMKIQ